MKILPGRTPIIGIILCLLIAHTHAASRAVVKKQMDKHPVAAVAAAGNSKSSSQESKSNSQENSSSSKPSVRPSTSLSSNSSSTPNSFDLADLAYAVGLIPIIGRSLENCLNYVGEMAIMGDQLTNGFLSRFLGGSLPCRIIGRKGIICSGTSMVGNNYQIFAMIINNVPDAILPGIMKDFILSLVQSFGNPLMDTLFGSLSEI